jgi:hypothetical protein
MYASAAIAAAAVLLEFRRCLVLIMTGNVLF